MINGVDLHRFDPAGDPQARASIRQRLHIAPDETIALLIAQDFARKGLATAIAATVRLSSNGSGDRFALVVVGKENPAKYRAMAARLQLGDRVIFAGPTDRPADFYRAADFFLLPTHHDPCSLVVLEALAMGLPVISTVQNGACQVMENGRHGFVLQDPGDVESLAGAIRQMLEGPRRRAMQAACLQLRPSLSVENHLHTLEEMYHALATA